MTCALTRCRASVVLCRQRSREKYVIEIYAILCALNFMINFVTKVKINLCWTCRSRNHQII